MSIFTRADRRALKAIKIISPDLHTAQQLYDCLYELLGEKWTNVARALDISPQAARKWDKDGIPHKWWGKVFQDIIAQIFASPVVPQKNSGAYKRRERIYNFYVTTLPRKVRQFHEDEDYDYSVDMNEVEQHVRDLLLNAKKHRMSWTDIIKAGNSGGFSPNTLRAALRSIGAQSKTSGFGEDKKTIWSLKGLSDED